MNFYLAKMHQCLHEATLHLADGPHHTQSQVHVRRRRRREIVRTQLQCQHSRVHDQALNTCTRTALLLFVWHNAQLGHVEGANTSSCTVPVCGAVSAFMNKPFDTLRSGVLPMAELGFVDLGNLPMLNGWLYSQVSRCTICLTSTLHEHAP